MKKTLLALVFTIFVILPLNVYGDDTLEGEWWIAIKGNTKGGAKFVFEGLSGGTFKVTGRGTTLSLGQFFVVANNQFLQRASNGNVSGKILINDDDSNAIGAFDFDKGRFNKTFTKLILKGELTNGAAVKVKFVGKRFPSEIPVLSGLTQTAKVGGKGLESKFYELEVNDDESRAEPFRGFPYFSYVGKGPVKVDGTEIDDVPMLGQLIVDFKLKAYGTFSSPVLGNGPVSGILREGQTANVPRAKLNAETGRKVRLKADLDQAVSPRIDVTPDPTLDFASVETGNTKTLSFIVSNTGTDIISGSASPADTNSPYTIVSGSPYSVAAGDSTTVDITFAPVTIGTFTTEVAFTGGGGATRSVTGTGATSTGGDDVLLVEPTEGFDFGAVELIVGDLLSAPTREFKVTNEDTKRLEGAATIKSGAAAFQLLNDLNVETSRVPYALDPEQSATVTVRFAPVQTGNLSAIVNFDGGGFTTDRNVKGRGIER